MRYNLPHTIVGGDNFLKKSSPRCENRPYIPRIRAGVRLAVDAIRIVDAERRPSYRAPRWSAGRRSVRMADLANPPSQDARALGRGFRKPGLVGARLPDRKGSQRAP